jgi:hypothetical protein
VALLETAPSKGFNGVGVENGDIVSHLVSECLGLLDKVHADEMLNKKLAVL